MEHIQKHKDKEDRSNASIPEQIPLPFMYPSEKKVIKNGKGARKTD